MRDASPRSIPQPVAPDPTTPISVYIHFPFCASRCHYCAFTFVVGHADARPRYLEAVKSELRRAGVDDRFSGRSVDSVYFGGGTPSLMEPDDVARLLEAVRAAFPMRADAEVSLEANPDGLAPAKLRGLRERGVNRLTLGWQSLRRGNLRLLTRTHSPADAERALTDAREAGFDNVGVDLIYGVPGQTAAAWSDELGSAVSLAPDHVSAYELTIEEGTRLARRRDAGRYDVPDEEQRARMFEATEDVLAAHGVLPYEISNFARPGFECRHNLASWRGGDLLGVGASAASHVTNTRWTNVTDLDEYVRCVTVGTAPAQPPEVLDGPTWAAEDLYLGLRTAEGADARTRLGRVGDAAARARLESVLRAALRDGLVKEDDRIRLTRRGRLLADSVFDALLAG